MSEPYEIERTLVLSTGHLKQQDFDELDDYFIADVHQYNTRVWVPEDDTNAVVELVDIFGLARKLECTWIKFDADGPQIEDLPFFGW